MSVKKTAWHPPFTGLLQERAPRWARVTPEVQLTTEPLRVDDVIEVWADRERDPSDTGETLRGMWRYVIEVALLSLVIVDLAAVAEREDDDLLRVFAGRRPHSLAAQRWMRQHQTLRSDAMSTQESLDLEGREEFVAFIVSGLTPKERMAGLKPEEIVSVLKPEEIAGALKPEHMVLALPLEILRGLSDEALATLPVDVQREVRARLGR